jgi:hypothetical protein
LGRIKKDPNLKETSSSKEMDDVFVEMKTDDDYTPNWFLLTFGLGWLVFPCLVFLFFECRFKGIIRWKKYGVFG